MLSVLSSFLTGRKVQARVPIAVLITELEQRGADCSDPSSKQGYESIVDELRQDETEINAAPYEPNPVWSILAENAHYFLSTEYAALISLTQKILKNSQDLL